MCNTINRINNLRIYLESLFVGNTLFLSGTVNAADAFSVRRNVCEILPK